MLQHMTVWAVGDEVYVECARAGSQELFDYLQKMIFWSDVQIEITDLAIVTVVSDSPAEPLDCCVASASYPLGVASGPLVTDLLVERSALLDAASLLVEQGYRLAGLMAWEAERVMAVMPEVGVDTDTTTIPHETYAFVKDQRAVHFDKGCYRGQETVARVHFLGRSPRTLVQVYLDGSVPELPAPGTPITAGGTRSVGVLGTVVDHADFGPIGLAEAVCRGQAAGRWGVRPERRNGHGRLGGDEGRGPRSYRKAPWRQVICTGHTSRRGHVSVVGTCRLLCSLGIKRIESLIRNAHKAHAFRSCQGGLAHGSRSREGKAGQGSTPA